MATFSLRLHPQLLYSRKGKCNCKAQWVSRLLKVLQAKQMNSWVPVRKKIIIHSHFSSTRGIVAKLPWELRYAQLAPTCVTEQTFVALCTSNPEFHKRKMWLQVISTSLTLQSLVMSWASPHGRTTLQLVLQTFTFFSSSRAPQQYNSSHCRVDGGRRAATRHQGNIFYMRKSPHLFCCILRGQEATICYGTGELKQICARTFFWSSHYHTITFECSWRASSISSQYFFEVRHTLWQEWKI